MAHNPFIFKQIIRTLAQSIDYIEATYEIGETISHSNKYIKATDTIKDKIEEKTGFHIDRHYEKQIGHRNYPKANDPEVIEMVKHYKEHENEVIARYEQDKLEMEKEKYEGLFPAIICNLIFWPSLILIISKLI